MVFVGLEFSELRGMRFGRHFLGGSQDAIIIGAGVIGNSIATELSRNGWYGAWDSDQNHHDGNGNTASRRIYL